MKELIESELIEISGGNCDTSFGYDAGRVLRYMFFSLGNGTAIAGMDWTITSGINEAICNSK